VEKLGRNYLDSKIEQAYAYHSQSSRHDEIGRHKGGSPPIPAVTTLKHGP